LKKGKAFFMVSSRRWGKSHALASLTSGKPLRRFMIDGTRFAIRRMSNDEDDEGFFDLLDNTYPDSSPHVVLAMCPTFREDRRRTPLLAALENFAHRYEMFFFVLGLQGKAPGKPISQSDIEPLKAFGTVEVYRSSIDPDSRARAFKKFILTHL
jgi:hypothetical protein